MVHVIQDTILKTPLNQSPRLLLFFICPTTGAHRIRRKHLDNKHTLLHLNTRLLVIKYVEWEKLRCSCFFLFLFFTFYYILPSLYFWSNQKCVYVSWVKLFNIKFIFSSQIKIMEAILKHLQWAYKYGSVEDIPSHKIIYSFKPVNAGLYPIKNLYLGRIFRYFKWYVAQINNVHNNSIYIQPSQWATIMANYERTTITDENVCVFGEHKKFIENNNAKTNVLFILNDVRLKNWNKSRHSWKKNVVYIHCIKRYDEDDYLTYLQSSKYGIILDAHESQGFAVQEALSTNVPLLVWDTKYMSQEEGGNSIQIHITTIPYWDERCGEYFHESDEFEKTFEKFIDNLET